MKYLVDNRIVYRRDPIKEEPTEVYDWGMYFENGTHGCYRLFTSKAKITTYKSLKWHLLTLWYLNPEMNKEQFARLAAYIVDKQNNFITFNVNEQSLNGVIEEVYNMELDTPPKNRARKVIFKDNCGLSVNEKLSIVGTIIGKSKKITEEDIYDAMLHINDNNQKITVSKIAKYLNVTTRTIYRTMSDQLNEEKINLNNGLCK